MDFCGKRLIILVVYWIIMETQLVHCKSQLQYHYQHHPNEHCTGCARGDVISLKLDHVRDAQAQDRQIHPDEGGPMPMLHWMRQMIFKTKSMYTKHKLEFELSGCFFGFIRKIISLIYNSIYSFNKKLIHAKNIKMEDIRGLGKTRNLNSTIPDLIFAENNLVEYQNKINNIQPSLNISKTKTSSTNDRLGDSIESNEIDSVIKVNDNKDKSIKEETEKLFTIHKQLERNLDKMNTIHENITKNFNSLKDTIYKISKQKVRYDNLNSKLFNNIVTNENQQNTTIIRINDTMGGLNSVNLELIENKTNLLHGLQNKREDKKSNHEIVNSFENNTPKLILPGKKSSDEISNQEVISQNEIPKSLINPFNDKQTKRFENHNKYIFTPAQIKLISNRVKRLLNYLSPKADQTEIYKVTSRQFSQESILDAMNAMIMQFLGLSPEEEGLAYWMSMVGKETSENLMMIGSGFNAMRHSQLFSCMANYGTTKFWHWIDSCC